MNKRAIIVTLAVFFLLPGLAVAGFTDNGNGTVTDATTNLMWQQCSAGWNGAACATDDLAVPNTYTWDNAIAYCEGLSLGGFTDWRLPNIKELKSLADMTVSNPAINATYFPNTIASNYWSSTSYAPDTASAWNVLFNYGYTNNTNKTIALYVRCVRGQ